MDVDIQHSKMKIQQNNSCFQLLLEDNFMVAKHCRNTMETLSEVSLRYYFQRLASKRSQFALELDSQIAGTGGKAVHVPSSLYERRWSEISQKNKLRNIRKTLQLYKLSMKRYKQVLSQNNDGNCREVLIRHKAHLAITISELRSLVFLVKQEQEQISGTGSPA